MSEEQNNQSKPILTVYNNHVPDCGEPPSLVDGPESDEYIGYFRNHHGEQWLFRYDFEAEKGVVQGGDADWERLYPVLGGIPINLILSTQEQFWVAVCWQAATRYKRHREKERGKKGVVEDTAASADATSGAPADLSIAQHLARTEAETLGYDWNNRPDEADLPEVDDPYLLDYSFCASLIAREKRPTPKMEAYVFLLRDTYFRENADDETV